MIIGEKNQQASKELREMVQLRFEPIAVKLIKKKSEIPENAIHPRDDMGKHITLCQAFSMTRRNKRTVYMDKKSEWCWNPLIGFGLVDCPEGSEAFEVVCKNLGIPDLDAARAFFAKFPTLPRGENIGILTAPLESCTFEPDLVLIYANNAQLRSMAWAIKSMTGKIISTEIDAIDSCVYSCVVPINTGEYRVTLPDIGEYERAAAGEDEIILSVPGHRVDELLQGLHLFDDLELGYPHLAIEMESDFARPPFYNELYKIWGLDQGEDWSR